MNNKPKLLQKYQKGNDVIYFAIYKSTTGNGDDEVLQHKFAGQETAHITLHPDNSVNFRVKRSKTKLQLAVDNGLSGYSPAPSKEVRQFLQKIRARI